MQTSHAFCSSSAGEIRAPLASVGEVLSGFSITDANGLWVVLLLCASVVKLIGFCPELIIPRPPLRGRKSFRKRWKLLDYFLFHLPNTTGFRTSVKINKF